MNNNAYVSGVYGPTLPVGWKLAGVADFNLDGKPEYLLFNPTTLQSAIWYLSNNALLWGIYGPILPAGWQIVAVSDFNGDNKPDYVMHKPATRQTAIWYLNNNRRMGGAYGPHFPATEIHLAWGIRNSNSAAFAMLLRKRSGAGGRAREIRNRIKARSVLC